MRLLDLHDLVLDEACLPLLAQLAAGGLESDADDGADVALEAAGSSNGLSSARVGVGVEDGVADGVAECGVRVLHAGVLRGRGVPFWKGTPEEALLEREQRHPLNQLIAHMQRSNLRSLDLYQIIGNASDERFDGDRQREGISSEQFARGLSVRCQPTTRACPRPVRTPAYSLDSLHERVFCT